MQDTTQVNIVSLQFVGLDQQTKSIETLKKQIKDLTNEIEKVEPSSKAFDFMTTANAQLKGELKEVLQAQKAANKAFEDSKHAVGSFRDLEAQLIKAKNALKGMKEGTPIFEKQSIEVKALDKEVKRLAADMGEMQRNVGNYDQAVENGLAKIHPHLVGMRGEIASVTGEIGNLASGLGGIGGQFGQLLGGGSQLLSAGGGLAAGMVVAQGFGEAFKYALETTKEVSKLRYEIQQLTEASGPQLEAFAAQVGAIAKVTGKQSEDIEVAAQNLTVLTGDYQASLNLLEQSYLSGAASSEDFLKQLKEYPSQFEKAGLSAVQFMNVIKAQKQMGVYDSKLVDAIKEGGIQIETMSVAATKAMTTLGMDANKVYADVSKGARTTGAVLQEVSRRAASLGKQDLRAQQAISDLFRAMGEDIPTDAIFALDKILSQEQIIIDHADPIVAAKEREISVTKELTVAQGELTDKLGGTGASMSTLGTQVETFFTKYLTAMMDNFSPLASILNDWWTTLSKIFSLFTGKEVRATLDFFDLFQAAGRAVTIPIRALAWAVGQVAEGIQFVTDKIAGVKMLGDAFGYVGKQAKSAMQFLGLVDKDAPKGVGGGLGATKSAASGETYAMPALVTGKPSPAQDAADKTAKASIDKRLAEEKKAIEDKYRAVNAELAKALVEIGKAQTLKYLLTVEDIEGVNGRGVTITPKTVLNEKALQDQVTQIVKDATEQQEYLYKIQQEKEKQRLEERATLINGSLGAASQGLDAIQSLEAAARDRALSDQQIQAKRELQILEEKHAAGLIMDQQYNQQKLALQKKDDAEQQALKEKYGKKMKAVAISQILVNLALQESQILLSATNPLNPANLATLGAAGIAAGITQMATLAVIAGIQIAAVSKQQYAQGGFINGPAHSGGGVDINAEGGEFVVNKRSMAIPYVNRVVNWANAVGNGTIPAYAPAPIPRQSGGGGYGNSDPALLEELRMVREAIRDQRVYNSVGDITNLQRQNARTVRNSMQ